MNYDELNNLVDSLGGKSKVARILDKSRSTVNRWCDESSDSTIDKANFVYLQNKLQTNKMLDDMNIEELLQELPSDLLINELSRRLG